MNTATNILTEKHSGDSLQRAGSGVRPVIRQSVGGCGEEVPHVYDTTVMPPHPDKRCRCGKQTWRKSEIEMMELRLKTFAAAQPPTSPSETVGREQSEDVSAAPPRVSNTTGDVTRQPNDELTHRR